MNHHFKYFLMRTNDHIEVHIELLYTPLQTFWGLNENK